MKSEYLKRMSVAGLAVLSIIGSTLVTAPVANATSGSDSNRYPNGAKITGNAWISTVAKGGCGKFQTSTVISKKPKWIDNETAFYQIGLGSISIKGATAGSTRGNKSLYWKNTNGAKGAYLSGSVCGGWGAIYVGLDLHGGALQYGTYRNIHVRL